MGGIFSKANRPPLPGAYFNWINQIAQAVQPGPGTVVAIPFTHDWGPFKEVVRVSSFGDFQAVYGSADDTDGYRAVKQAFIGEGLPGRGGAGEVVAVRWGGSAAAKSTHNFNNTTPASAITLTAKYEGTKGNDLKVTTQNHAADAAKNELLLFDGTTLLEKYVYTDTNITDLAAQINELSDWVDATMHITGVALATVSGTALTGGNDGTTLIGSDWTDIEDLLAVEDFDVFAPYNLTDDTIMTAAATWIGDLNDAGRRCFAVFGGDVDETITDALTRSGELANPNIINVGVGTLTDNTLGSGGVPLDLSTAMIAPRIAGILAARSEYKSLTSARLAGVDIKSGPDVADQQSAFDGGVLVFTRDSVAAAPVHVLAGVTTWTSTDAATDPTKPYLIYRQPKYVATMHGIEKDLTEWAEENSIGSGSIDDDKRAAIVAEVTSNLAQRAALGAVQEGFIVQIDQDPPPTPDDEFIALAISVKFGRSLEQIFFSVTVG
jgi:hypothetical protein